MASIGKPKIRISSKDLKQAVLKKNKSLESKNKILESSLKDKEKELKSLEKELSSESKEYGKLLTDIEFQEERLQKLNGGVYSTDKLLKSKLDASSKADKNVEECEDKVIKLQDEESKLLDEIAKLEFYKAKCEQSKVELAGIQVKKDNATEKLNSVYVDIEQAEIDSEKKIALYEAQYDALEVTAKKHEDMVHMFEQRLFEAKDQVLKEENKLENILSKSKTEKEKVNNELQAVKNLVGNTEDEYIKWEQKIAKAKVKADKEEGRNKKAIERFKNWKIGVLEEVARLKLKSKVDKIDKAGLSEILNG